MNAIRDDLKQKLLTGLNQYWPGDSQVEIDVLILLWLVLFTVLLHFFLHGFVLRLLTRVMDKAGRQWQQLFSGHRLFRRVAFVAQGVILQIQAALWLDNSSILLRLITTATNQWILLFGLLAFFSMLNSLEKLTYGRATQTNFPIRGVIQTVKLLATVFVVVLAISQLMGKSPFIFLSGLGALSAVMMLVFKDPILGLVAGIQLSANDMLAVGDWLEMPKYGADGDVIDIGLTTVKISNWDKTITTIPTYALISDSFKNWRGMTEAGGRRIKRSVLIDVSSIRFLDDEMLQRLKKAELLGTYLEGKSKAIEHANSKKQIDMSVRLNGLRLTNIGTFRRYLLSYLQAHPDIHKTMTLMVRQLESSTDGLPIEIYAFTSTTNWSVYEDIQADIFDHLFAVLPDFGLRAHEAPTGHDVRALVEKK